MGVTVLVFAIELQKVRTKCVSSDFGDKTVSSFKMACMWKGQEELKNPFLQNLHRDITVRTQFDKDCTKMKIKVSQHKFNIHCRGSPEEVELNSTRTAYVMHIPNIMSLISARNNRKRKFKQRFSSVNFILMLLHMSFFTAAILLCAVRNAQCITSESP